MNYNPAEITAGFVYFLTVFCQKTVKVLILLGLQTIYETQ